MELAGDKGLSTLPLVSVCIANFNGTGLIEACLRSVREQAGAPSFEIIVHDDASTDDSAAIVAADPRVRLLRSATNVGFCIANNRMAEAARGRYLLLLNNDAELFPDALATLAAESAARSDRAIIGLPQYDARTGALVERGVRLDIFANPVPMTAPGDAAPAMVFGACLWIPREHWCALGGFPEWFEMNVEDMFLCCRARVAGLAIDVCARSGYRHHGGATFGSNPRVDGRAASNVRRRYLSERNKTLVMCVFYPALLLLVLLPVHALLLLLEGLVVALANRDPRLLRDVYFRALRDAGTRWRAVLAERRLVAATRRIGRIDFFARFSPWPRKLQLARLYGVPVLER